MALQLSDCDPEKGLRLELAMGWYGDQAIAETHPCSAQVAVIEESARYSSRHGLRPGHSMYIDPARLPDLHRRAYLRRRLLLDDIAAQLRSGKLYALGLRVGEYTPDRISREWWQVASLNPELNSAEGNGVTFSGLLVFAAETTAISEALGSESAERARAWMREHVVDPGSWKRDAAIASCSKAAGVSFRSARKAWSDLPNDIRGARGVHK